LVINSCKKEFLEGSKSKDDNNYYKMLTKQLRMIKIWLIQDKNDAWIDENAINYFTGFTSYKIYNILVPNNG
jgi:hypothetical protein